MKGVVLIVEKNDLNIIEDGKHVMLECLKFADFIYVSCWKSWQTCHEKVYFIHVITTM